ncbi:PAS domain S-box protein [Neobacillus dielmonensis]|uniref:PAS domain S-box protein n=1 Tax=Neobacillus dielmonensis TaxID=1347369 RepID=UPI000694683D|nr:PAS domain S-box protein [Neobacillus dielmonensis]
MNTSILKIKQHKRDLLENHIKGSLNQYSSLFGCDSDAIYVMDLDGFFLPLNPACERIFGYDPQRFSKLTYMKVVTVEHLDRALSFFYKALEGKLQNFDCQVIHQNGAIIDVNITNYPIVVDEEIIGVYGIAKNITEIKQRRRRLTEEIQQREEVYREIVEHSPDAVVIAKHEQILFANNTALHLVGGKEKSEIIGRNIYDFLLSDYKKIIKERVKLVETGKIVDFIEIQLVRLDGEIMDVEIKAIPAIYQNEPARHIIIRDITEKKRTQKMLLQSEKLTVAGQLAAGIAHEIRNPLTAIKGFLQLMESDKNVKSTYIDIINSEMNRIEQILSELLLLSKPQGQKIKETSIIKILQNVKALIDAQAILNNTNVTISCTTKIPHLVCDENQLKQVFINLLKNSIEAMPDGGTINIEVDKYNENSVMITVSDQGSGIANEHLDHVGQPFFTTKENGTGLGLMISMQIIKNHNGTFHISSSPNGTIIEITLPL